MSDWSAEHAERFLLSRFENALVLRDHGATRFWELALEYGAHLSETRFRVQLAALGADSGQVAVWLGLVEVSRVDGAQDFRGKPPLTVPVYEAQGIHGPHGH